MTRPPHRLLAVIDGLAPNLRGTLPTILGETTMLENTPNDAKLRYKVVAGLFIVAVKFEEAVQTELLHIAVDLSPPAIRYALHSVAAKIVEAKIVETKTTHEDLAWTIDAVTGRLLRFGLRPEVQTDLLGIAQGIATLSPADDLARVEVEDNSNGSDGSGYNHFDANEFAHAAHTCQANGVSHIGMRTDMPVGASPDLRTKPPAATRIPAIGKSGPTEAFTSNAAPASRSKRTPTGPASSDANLYRVRGNRISKVQVYKGPKKACQPCVRSGNGNSCDRAGGEDGCNRCKLRSIDCWYRMCFDERDGLPCKSGNNCAYMHVSRDEDPNSNAAQALLSSDKGEQYEEEK